MMAERTEAKHLDKGTHSIYYICDKIAPVNQIV